MSIMKNFLVIVSLCIFAKFFVLADITEEQKESWKAECLAQLNVTDDEGELQIDREKEGCYIVCMIKKIMNTDETLLEFMKRAVEEVKPLDPELYQIMLDKLNKCWDEADGDECKFMNCIDLFSGPFALALQLKANSNHESAV